MKASHVFAGVCLLALSPLRGQVYLIQGNPTPKYNGGYPTSLLRVAGDGSVATVSQILPGGRTGGTEWIGLSYEAQKAVFLSKAPNHTVTVVDLGAAAIAKTCEAPPAPAGMSSFPFEQWLADPAGVGFVYVEHFGTTDLRRLEAGRLTGGDYSLRGMTLDPSVPCDQSFLAMTTGQAALAVVGGTAGVVDPDARDVVDVGTDADGAIWRGWFGGERTYLGYRLPIEILGTGVRPSASMMLDNRQILGVALRYPAGTWQLAVLRKNDNTWHVLPAPRAAMAFVRGFGTFVAVAETAPGTAQGAESAGRAEWRKTEAATGPSIEERLENLPYVLPGKLDLYDVATEKMYHITTNQGDSEILLVDDGTVYYRVSDRLFSAAIMTQGLRPAKLLAQSESIRDVHWAFVKR